MNHQHQNPYGVGLAYRHVIHDAVMRSAEHLDLIEVTTEDYINRQRRLRGDSNLSLLREALAELPATAHGLTLSIGSVDQPNTSYLEGTRRFLETHQLEIFSEHLAFHQMDGTDLGIFLPMPFEEIAIEWLKHAYIQARAKLGRPFALENVTYYFPIPHCGLSEADFLRRLTEETDCTLLLDVTNVFNNAHNHGYDPGEFLDRLPLDRVSQIHLAGGHQTDDGRWEDSHSAPVMEAVWPLYEEVVRRTAAGIVILERDSKFDPFETVIEDVDRAREIFYRHRPSEPPTGERARWQPRPGKADPEAQQFQELRAFQRTMLARLTDPQIRKDFAADPIGTGRQLGMNSGEWVRRAADCDPRMFAWVAEGWDLTRDEEALFEQDSEDNEWAAWAAELAKF